MKAPTFSFGPRVLGFTVSDRGPIRDFALVFLSRDPDEHHQIALATGRPRDATFTTSNQISLRLSGLDQLKAVHEELLAEGIGGDLARRLKTTVDAS